MATEEWNLILEREGCQCFCGKSCLPKFYHLFHFGFEAIAKAILFEQSEEKRELKHALTMLKLALCF